MSLKAFHIVFICASELLALWFGVWSLRAYSAEGMMWHLIFGLGSFMGAVALLAYGWYFLKKLKNISYL
jgi:hypothetical protein